MDLGGGSVAHCIKPLLETLAFLMWAQVCVPVALLPIHLPANEPSKIVGHVTYMWETRMEFLDPGFGLVLPWLLWLFGN